MVDLFAVRHDGFPDLWELKRPRDPVFRSYNDWLYHSPETAKGMGQLVDYCDIARNEPQLTRGYEAREGLGSVFMNRPRAGSWSSAVTRARPRSAGPNAIASGSRTATTRG